MTILLLNANALHIPLADGSVSCVVTSPPYYGLRDYGTASWEGGNLECDHLRPRLGGNGEKSPINGKGSERDESVGLQQYKNVCRKCGAHRIDNQIGLEETPEAYVEKLVAVFREVRRVLSSDGVLWLNLGDSYAGSGGPGSQYDSKAGKSFKGEFTKYDNPNRKVNGLKPKDLIGIPWMVAFALRADGWYLRSEIIWHKPNPMPESVTDRPTKAHEQIFLLSKSAQYFYDHEAIKEPGKYSNEERYQRVKENHKSAPDEKKNGIRQRKPAGWDTSRQGAHGSFHREGRAPDVEYTTTHALDRNKRTVWTVATQPYSGAHFATFPAQLIEPCIKAGCPKDGIVLDPFSGSGTTAMVARKLGRRAIGLDLSFTYIQECARPRLQLDALEEFQSGKKAESNYSDLPLFTENK